MAEIYDLKKVGQEEIKALQSKSLEILLYFKKFCEEHNLLFYLCGGCCIGTIRHKGFIPWDDDIDVFMPREDYEKLSILWEKFADTERYSYCRTNADNNYHHTAASIRDNYTTFINRHSQEEDIIHGVAIEIAPLDGYPDSKLKRLHQIIFAMIYSLFNAQRLPDNQGKIIRNISRIILSIVKSKRIRYKIWSFAEKQMTKYKFRDCDYVTELVTGIRYMKLKYPKEVFEDAIYKEFEGHLLPIPKGYDLYLRMAFGNYMELPPIEDRVPKHNTVYINLNESYKKYKGIYYCVGKDVKKSE